MFYFIFVVAGHFTFQCRNISRLKENVVLDVSSTSSFDSEDDNVGANNDNSSRIQSHPLIGEQSVKNGDKITSTEKSKKHKKHKKHKKNKDRDDDKKSKKHKEKR